MEQPNIHANEIGYKHIGWKTYNTIIKKAVEQEFSGQIGGLVVNLSIAFFIVIISAFTLNLDYESIQTANKQNQLENKAYQHLETIKYLPILEENYLEYNRIQKYKQVDYNKLLYLRPLLV